jgi:hypothetical protein
MERLEERRRGLKQLHLEYLDEIAKELSRRREWSETETEWGREQKVVNEYNM